jgi:protein FrlC
MKIAFNTWAYSSFPTLLPCYTLADTIHRLARIGWRAIEVGCAAPTAYPAYIGPEERREIRRLADGEGVRIVSMLPAPGGGAGLNPCSPVAAERTATVAHYGDVIRFAADLGAETVLYIPGWVAVGMECGRAWAHSRDALAAIADMAAEHGLRVAVEPTTADTNLVDTAADAVRLMREVDRANVGVMFDTCHVLAGGEDCRATVATMGADLIHLHAAERGRKAIGDGDLDWAGLIQALKAVNFDGYFTVEAGFASRDDDPDEVARRSLVALARLIGDA